MVEIYSKSLVRAIGKVLLMKFSGFALNYTLVVRINSWTITMLFYQTCKHFSHLILYHIPHLASLVVFLYFFQF